MKTDKPKIHYSPDFNLKNKKTGKIIYLDHTQSISFDPDKYEIIYSVRKKETLF